MRSARAVVAVLAGVVLACAASSDASAFCRSTTCRTSASGGDCPTDDDGCPSTGAKLSWPTSCVSWAMNALGTQDLDPGDTRDVLRKAFQAWTDVPCPDGGTASMTFSERDPVACKKSEYNGAGPNVNVVIFQDNDWTYHGIDGTLAKTSVTYNDQTGEIYDADIEVNAANNTVTITDDPVKVEYDLQSIVTHEVGHFIGLAHTPDPTAIMFASYAPGSIARELTPDDIAAVCAVYVPNDGVVCNTVPRGGFSGTCDDPPKSGICSVSSAGAPASGRASLAAGVAVIAAAVIAVRGRRRRRDA